jgi:2-dehydro-3-deoxygalactonokinase
MRGEETQVIGACRRTERELLIGLPGTHSKWVRVVDGRIEHFDTFMTGEVYAPCAPHHPGRTMQKPEAADDAAFLRGAGVALGRARRRALQHLQQPPWA